MRPRRGKNVSVRIAVDDEIQFKGKNIDWDQVDDAIKRVKFKCR